MTNPTLSRIQETIREVGSHVQYESTAAAVVAAVFEPMSDDELRSAYLATDGEGPLADLMCVELAARNVDL